MVAVELDGFVAGWEPYRVTWKAFTRNPRDAFRHVITALTRQSRVI